jgi:hypothetical protein
MKNFLKSNLNVGLVGAVVGVILVTSVSNFTQVEKPLVEKTPEVPASRLWMEYTEDIVRSEKIAPPESARLYAYVSTAYFEVLSKTNSTDEASIVTRDIINKIKPDHKEKTEAKLVELSKNSAEKLSSQAKEVFDKLAYRSETDGLTLVWDGVIPTGEEIWNGKNPLKPAAKDWQRWIVEGVDFVVPLPPKWGSEEHKAALAEVKSAAINRTTEQSAAINFWGGVPGTEAPAGIWQNVFFEEVKEYNLSDKEYAYAQMVLAQAVADSFLECWKVKYTYWTKRPSMVDATLVEHLEMDNPNFPSYVSGHSTISRTAAGVLGALFPEKSEVWLKNAEEARDSRLWAGIHFPYDNNEGFRLGAAVADSVIEKLNLTSIQ